MIGFISFLSEAPPRKPTAGATAGVTQMVILRRISDPNIPNPNLLICDCFIKSFGDPQSIEVNYLVQHG